MLSLCGWQTGNNAIILLVALLAHQDSLRNGGCAATEWPSSLKMQAAEARHWLKSASFFSVTAFDFGSSGETKKKSEYSEKERDSSCTAVGGLEQIFSTVFVILFSSQLPYVKWSFCSRQCYLYAYFLPTNRPSFLALLHPLELLQLSAGISLYSCISAVFGISSHSCFSMWQKLEAAEMRYSEPHPITRFFHLAHSTH